MTYSEFLKNTRAKIESELNEYLEEEDLQPIKFFVKNGYDVTLKPFSLAIYADSPEGNVYSQTDGAINGKVTVEFFLNKSADKVSSDKLEEYFSAIAEYLATETFGEYSIVEQTQIVRMDSMGGCNECLFLLNCRIETTNDSYFGD